MKIERLVLTLIILLKQITWEEPFILLSNPYIPNPISTFTNKMVKKLAVCFIALSL